MEKEKGTEKGRADVKEIKLKRIEEALKRIKEEKELEKVSQERETERRRKYIEDNKVKENDRIIREKQKTEKIQKKKKLEQKWEMVRWLTRFLEDNKGNWEELNELREQSEKARLEKEAWENKNLAEKESQVKSEAENNILSREAKIQKAKERRKCWTDWRSRDDQPTGGDGQPAGREVRDHQEGEYDEVQPAGRDGSASPGAAGEARVQPAGRDDQPAGRDDQLADRDGREAPDAGEVRVHPPGDDEDRLESRGNQNQGHSHEQPGDSLKTKDDQEHPVEDHRDDRDDHHTTVLGYNSNAQHQTDRPGAGYNRGQTAGQQHPQTSTLPPP